MRMSRHAVLTEQDRATWALYVRQVAPLAGVAVPDAPPELVITSQAGPQSVASVSLPAVQRLAPVMIGHHPPGVDKATWNRFRTGKLSATRTLDLHGRTAQRAFSALQDFLGSAHAEKLRCVEVITGRGSGETGGVIRREFPLWLNQPELRPLVLAAAHPHAANPGSVRLLLRRVRPGK